ncbi:MAG TPA: DUF4331 family protein [Chthoniobacteraceae bacterium]
MMNNFADGIGRALRRQAIRLLTPALVASCAWLGTGDLRASDARDAAGLELNPALDLNDLYVFPGAGGDRIVLAMTTHVVAPLDARFDPTALYEFKIDNTGDAVEDLVIQFQFRNVRGGKQRVAMFGPAAPKIEGRKSRLAVRKPTVSGGTEVSLQRKRSGDEVQLFAGRRAEPFYFDLSQFLRIIPDRRPARGSLSFIGPAPEASAFRPNGGPGQAQFDQTHGVASNFFTDAATMAIVVELPEALIKGEGNNIGVWATVSRVVEDRKTWAQVDRVGNPFVNMLFIEKREHDHNNSSTPEEDVVQFRPDISRFVTTVAGRDPAYANAVAAALTPDRLVVRLDKNAVGPTSPNAGWLSNLLDPANGYGGRKLDGDDVADKVLAITFGNALGNNNNVSPGLVTDNVNDPRAESIEFPYLVNTATE